jgi:outer membrane murein-binding lipoprotein Lpp
MKKIIITVVALALSTSLLANNKEKAQLASDMREMLSAVELIQKGGFYSKPQMMKEGVKKLNSKLAILESSDASKYLPDGKKRATKFANKRAKMIEMYADDLVLSIDSNNMDDALDNYTQIIRQCTSCHIRIRPY